MRKIVGLFCILAALGSCATTPQQKRVNELVSSHPFEFFFTGPDQVQSFDSLEEARDYVEAAQKKLVYSINKSSVQGLTAKLSGDWDTTRQNVVVVHFFEASDAKIMLDLKKNDTALVNKLAQAISVSSVFLVFSADRAVSISDFYLDSRYRYTSNSQYRSYNFDGHVFATKYPVGWGNSQGFRYLSHELD